MGASDVLADRLAAAESGLAAAAGSTSLCELGRSGGSAPAIKESEGAWAALREVRQAVRTGADVAEAAREAEDRWREDLNRKQARGASADWLAYVSGGVRALGELRSSLSG